jgi:hypothetical protein
MFCKIVVCSFGFNSFNLQICRSSFVLFLLAIVLSVLRFTASEYPFGIFKLFFPRDSIMILHMNMTVFDPSGHRPWKLLSSLLWRLLRSVEWLLFNAIWAIFQIYHGKNKLHFDEVLMSALSWTSMQLVLAHWNNSPWVDKSLHSWHIIPI